ncbi:MAG: HDOD domain-containing protein [Gammaproteobacteria bacterium]|nr:HDOD domain-containing protein [Gammaproteobacteria bacterium]NIR97650.1 HDOD domain-containing protein [Gammaproteobacteria bacterium]NIT63311.1 HDOD domain-containing protein [Gammaproteobacteria bacterium]NIV20229.1 HDOD domain-containing protein [Gammaproteobacteria bacterium]NIX10646.1 HDOD domain-containing protein [Gammaproteobacteria bacterium]
MPVPATIQRFLDRQLVHYEVLAHSRAHDPAEASASVEPSQLTSTIALHDRRGALVAVIPADRELDLDALNRELDRSLTPMEPGEAQRLFPDCEAGIVPALSGAYGVKAITIDLSREEVYLRASATELIRLRKRDLVRIQNAWRATAISRPRAEVRMQGTPAAVKQRIRKLSRLPPMPEMAQRIFQLRANPSAGIEDLVPILEMDPSLAAQVMRYARSPFFGYRGRVDSLQQAVSRVLGYDMTANIIFGIAVGQSFRNPKGGPLGLDAFWRHALYCASLAQVLGRAAPPHSRPKPGLAYLAGMLHNFGLLLLGHLCQPEFHWLNKRVAQHPEVPMVEIEIELLGTTHMELGAWLAEHWNLPAEVAVAARAHHDPDYTGVHAAYAHLVLIANRLLKGVGMGDAPSTELPEAALTAVGIGREQAEQALARVLEAGASLDAIASQLAA